MADLKAFAEQLVNLTVKEVNVFCNYKCNDDNSQGRERFCNPGCWEMLPVLPGGGGNWFHIGGLGLQQNPRQKVPVCGIRIYWDKWSDNFVQCNVACIIIQM